MINLMKDPNVVFIFQDESIFHAKDSLVMRWADASTNITKKGQGKGMMASGWFDADGKYLTSLIYLVHIYSSFKIFISTFK
jgi:hypothetical protein